MFPTEDRTAQGADDDRQVYRLIGHPTAEGSPVDPAAHLAAGIASGTMSPGVLLTASLVDAARAVWDGASAEEAAAAFGLPVADVRLVARKLKLRPDEGQVPRVDDR